MKGIAWALGLVAAGIVALTCAAAASSHAQRWWEGVAHWPTYHSSINKVKLALDDEESARFRDLYISAESSGALCGTVNAKNRMGAYVGYRSFYVDANGVRFAGDEGVYGSPSAFLDGWVKSCVDGKHKATSAL